MNPPTQRQQQYLAYIRDYTSEHGISPTYREIQRHFGLRSITAVSHTLGVLREKGAVEWQPGVERSLKVV